jgi:hypothetical protein
VTVIDVPAPLPHEPEPEVQPAAADVLTEVRAAATAVSDTAAWARSHGTPDDFTGQAADAAGRAVASFAGDTDAVAAALERGALAIDRYLDQMARRRDEHVDLMERRGSLNAQREALISRINHSTEDDVPALRSDARALATRFDAYLNDLQAWRDRITANEDAAVAALQAVDTVAEGQGAADGPRVDTAGLAAQLRRLGNDTDAVNRWWKGLSQAERNALLISDPDLVGNTNGIPTGDRDEANRAAVDRDIEHLLGLQQSGHQLSPQEQRWLDNAQAVVDAIAKADDPPYDSLHLDVNVMAYQPHAFGGDGIAAVAFGDPDTADNTAVFVPGIMQDGTTIDENAEDALALQAAASGHGGSVATIAWLGYDSPNWDPNGSLLGYPDSAGDAAHTLTEANAEAGGHALAQFVDGLNSTHQGGADASHLTVIGHSYGSTTAAHAAADGLDADSLVLIGSPGAGGGVHDVSGLHMPAGQVFVGSAANDPVTWLGGEIPIQVPGGIGLGPLHLGNLGLGDDPSQHDFGAIDFQVDDGQSFHGVGGLVNTGFMHNHTSYFHQGNPALDNMAQVVSGHGDQVVDTGGRHQDAHEYLYNWAGSEVQHGIQQAYEQHVQPVIDTVTGTAVGTYTTVTGAAGAAWDTAQHGFDAVWPDSWP